MLITLTGSSSETLNERWHDQSLDVESIKFERSRGDCSFSVCETDEENRTALCAVGRLGLFRIPLRRCLVGVNNVSAIELRDAEGQAELYVEHIETASGKCRIRCTNGTFELTGQNLVMSLECIPLTPDELAEERRLSLLVTEISWRRRLKRRA